MRAALFLTKPHACRCSLRIRIVYGSAYGSTLPHRTSDTEPGDAMTQSVHTIQLVADAIRPDVEIAAYNPIQVQRTHQAQSLSPLRVQVRLVI